MNPQWLQSSYRSGSLAFLAAGALALPASLHARPDAPPVPPGAGDPGTPASTLPVVRVVASDPTALAGSTSGAFTLIREDPTNAPLTVTLTISGTAQPGVAYTALPSTVVIPAGFLAVDLIVRPLQVPLSAQNKNVVVTVGTNTTYEVGTRKSATVLIAEDRFNDFPPTVSLTSPTNGTAITLPSTVLTATASDADDQIAKVSFFAGDHLIGVATNPPYSVTWTGYGAGKYSLFAKVVDTAGLAGLSSTVSVTVSNIPPVVSLTSPTNKSVFLPGADIPLKAEASDGNDSVVKVTFLVDGRPVASATTAPYTAVWTNALPGNHSITAKAEDQFGRVVTSESAKIVVSDAPPTVTITSPAEGAKFGKPSNLTFTADASDPDDGVAKVSFFLDGQLVGSAAKAPYSVMWTNAVPGTHSVVARAMDTWGLSASSKAVRFTVTNAPPVVNITSPTNNAAFTAPAAISIATEATDADGSILRVSFWANERLLGVVDKPPFTFLWKDAPAGKYKLVTQATDDNGIRTTSAAVTVVVNAAPH